MWPICKCAACDSARFNIAAHEREVRLRAAPDRLIAAPEVDQLRELIRQTVVYLDTRVGNKPDSRGYALLRRLNAALIRKD